MQTMYGSTEQPQKYRVEAVASTSKASQQGSQGAGSINNSDQMEVKNTSISFRGAIIILYHWFGTFVFNTPGAIHRFICIICRLNLHRRLRHNKQK